MKRHLKQFGKTCFISSRGGITLFLAIIFLAMVLLSGIFIDAARILVAERKVQSSLNTAARSVLAKYDEEMAGQFGIYGLAAKSKEAALKTDLFRYFNTNLTERHEGIKLIDYKVTSEDISITTMGSLLSDEIYKRQILEYMKYKAPLLISENIAEKFKSTGIKEKLEFTEKESFVRNIWRSIRNSLTEFNKMAEEIGKSIGQAAILNFKASLMESINSGYGDTIKKLEDLKRIHENAGNCLIKLDNELEDYTKARLEALEASRKAKAEPTGDEFINVKSVGENLEKIIGSNISKIDYLLNIISSKGSELANLKIQLENLKKEVEVYTENTSELDVDKNTSELETDINASELETDKITSEFETDINSKINELEADINKKISELQSEIEKFELTDLGGIVFQEAEANEPPHEGDSENRKGFFDDLEKSIRSKLLLNSIKGIGGLISEEEYERASKEDREEFGALTENLTDVNWLGNEEIIEKQNSNILSFMKKFLNLLSDTAVNSRDNIFVTEYIMDKFTFMTSQTERDHYFNKAEIEYILCGQDIEAENAALLLGSTWFLRFGINTVDYFATSKIPHPVARIIWALTEGAISAFKDIYELYTTKKGCAICPSVPNIKVSYSDHLRLFLLVKNKEIQLKRMRQLLQADLMKKNPDFRIMEYETIVKANAKVKVNLLFLPLLQLDKIIPEQFKGGKYVVKKEIVTGY